MCRQEVDKTVSDHHGVAALEHFVAGKVMNRRAGIPERDRGEGCVHGRTLGDYPRPGHKAANQIVQIVDAGDAKRRPPARDVAVGAAGGRRDARWHRNSGSGESCAGIVSDGMNHGRGRARAWDLIHGGTMVLAARG